MDKARDVLYMRATVVHHWLGPWGNALPSACMIALCNQSKIIPDSEKMPVFCAHSMGRGFEKRAPHNRPRPKEICAFLDML